MFSRRNFLIASASTGLGLLYSGRLAGADLGNREDYESLIPSDKKLPPDWVKSLFERGTPEVLSGDDLKYVGMPIGGICTGQLYIGGDGQLWHWDIFNQNLRTREYHYAEPVVPTSPLHQRFLLTVDGEERPLNREGFPGVTFRGEYPIATVDYVDSECPVAVKLQAFSPFIPLNADDSGLPATIFEFTLRNVSRRSVEVSLVGELENGVCLYNRSRIGVLRSRQCERPGMTVLLHSADASDAEELNVDKSPISETTKLDDLPDYGTMALTLLGASADHVVADKTVPFGERLIGLLGRTLQLAAGESTTVTFLFTWHFRNLSMLEVATNLDRYYAIKFQSADDVAQYVATNFDRLARATRLWHRTWYDSTLPYWFLDRTMLNTSILATSTSSRMENGRYYGWEGVGCCPGTCTHVYQYAHATARLFPELERDTRERVDFGLAQKKDGVIHFRGEWKTDIHYSAVDGQAGTILRALREHQVSADDEFLHRNWPKIKLATQWLIAKDANGDGIIEDAQHNTLDTDWYGAVAWLSGIYLGALRAAAQMADEINDVPFALQCRGIADRGKTNLVTRLFDGEYFINELDPSHPESINTGSGCEIDQVIGQSWAWQVGLPRVLPEAETKSALKSLWKYNFAPDVGPYRHRYPEGRWFAMPGEAGMLLCTFPRKDWDYQQAKGQGPEGYAGYLSECMSGFEYQVAGHMLWEGLVLEGLALTRAVHDRYRASQRNPWNEVESGDHYSRSMASYGVYLAACGYEYHGPMRHIGFSPRLTPEDFRCAFTGAESWGTYAQKIDGTKMEAALALRWGSLRLKTVSLAYPTQCDDLSLTVTLDGQNIDLTVRTANGRVLIELSNEICLLADQSLIITLAC